MTPGAHSEAAVRPQSASGSSPTPQRDRCRVRHSTFANLDEFAHRGAPPGFEMTLTGRETGPWITSSAMLVRSTVRFGTEGGANVGHAHISSKYALFQIPVAGPAPLCYGEPLLPNRMAIYGPDTHQIEAVRGPSRWVGYSVATDLATATLARHGAPDALCALRSIRVVSVPRAHYAPLRATLAEIDRRIRDEPASFEDPAVREELETRMLDGVARAIVSGRPSASPSRGANAFHDSLLIEAMNLLGSKAGMDATVHDLCSALRVSQRTLSRVFRGKFGLSPARYLKLRRMNQVRACLRRGEPAPSTVTEVATRFGFFELGRFAGEYRALFGQAPSDALRSRHDAWLAATPASQPALVRA